METKKKAKGDLEGRKNSFLLLGLVIVLSLVYASFELFATTKNETALKLENELSIDVVEKTIYVTPKSPPKAEKIKKDVIIEIYKGNIDLKPFDIPFDEFDPFEEVPDAEEIKIIQPEVADIIIPFAEKMPEFPGGNDDLQTYLKKEVKYPQEALKIGVSGTVLVAFVVEKDGRISNVKVLIASYPDLDAEAVRVISGFPKWNPGSQMGKPVRVSMQLPIRFTIN